MKTILAPIDFSTASKQVVTEAAQLARVLRARLILLHVVQPPIVTDSDLGPQTSADYIATATRSAAKNLIALKKFTQNDPLKQARNLEDIRYLESIKRARSRRRSP